MNIISISLSIIIAYLIGSVPFALIIGRRLFKVDVRNLGSGNLGATNVARTLGKKAGLIVIILDLLKNVFATQVVYVLIYFLFGNDKQLATYCFLIAGIFSTIGHCFPIFAKFKGGKAVSSIGGFVLSSNYLLFIFGLIIFIISVSIKRIVSVGSMIMSLICTIVAFTPLFVVGMYPHILYDIYYPLTLTFITIFLVIRHLPNIRKLVKGQEKEFKLPEKK